MVNPSADIIADGLRSLEAYPEVSVVCFDFFDTLVYRTIQPEYTKRLACRRLGLLLKTGVSGEDLYAWRRDLEAEMCQGNAEKGGDHDFNILEFADGFYDLLGRQNAGLPDFFSRDAFRSLLLNIEITVELGVQRVCADAASLLKRVVDKGYRTALVSDFYIPLPHFDIFLSHHGFGSDFEKVFISSDSGRTKASGRLYDTLIRSIGCEAGHILMVGDNPHSDVTMASRKGIHALYVDRSRQKEYYERWAAQQQNPTVRQPDRLEPLSTVVASSHRALFPEMAATLFRFTALLFRRLIDDGVRNVFFFSKEGEFLKRLFDRFQEDHFGGPLIRSHYLLVSRKSTFICSVKPLDEENFARLFNQYRDISPRDFLLSLGFAESEAAAVCDGLSINLEKRLENFGTSRTYVTLATSRRFAQVYESKRGYQKQMLLRYLDSFGLDLAREGMHIVDVGWKGSIQDNIYFALDGTMALSGYYLGLLRPTNVNENNRKTGILFADAPVETPYFEVYNSNRSLFEMLLAATHGSADSYWDKEMTPSGEKRKPQGDAGIGVAGGEVVVRTVDLPEERHLFETRIKPLQDRMLSAFREIGRRMLATAAPFPDDEWFARKHARMMLKPSRAEIRFFEELVHLENFGVFEFTGFDAGGHVSVRRRWSNFKRAMKYPETVFDAGVWAPVVLNRLGLGLFTRFLGNRRHRQIFKGRKSVVENAACIARNRSKSSRLKTGAKIAFLLGVPEINGGTYVVFEHAVRLKRKGNRVFIVTHEPIAPERYAWHPDAQKLEWVTFAGVAGDRFDFAVATWWQSALHLGLIRADTYLYFVQSIETRFFPPDDRIAFEAAFNKHLAESTYRLPLPVITEARWIRRYLQERYGHDAQLVRNGIRKEIYTGKGFCHAPRQHGRLRVLVEGPIGVAYKNVTLAVSLSRRSEADEVWLLTSSAVDALEGVDRVFSQVPIGETPPIYRSCDVLVKLSTVEGMFGPPLEMFHCGGTAVVFAVTGHDEYIRHDVNSLVVPAGDGDGVVDGLNRLKRQPDLLERLKQGARETAQKWPDWETASAAFENALAGFSGITWPDRSYLCRATGALRHHAESRARAVHFPALTSIPVETPQCCQIFWHHGDSFSEQASVKTAYRGGRWVRIRQRLSFDAVCVHLRIDPCMQAGFVFVRELRVRDPGGGTWAVNSPAEDRWDAVRVDGTATVVDAARELILEAFSDDPQLMLPPMTFAAGKGSVEIELTLKCLPFPVVVAQLPAIGQTTENNPDATRLQPA